MLNVARNALQAVDAKDGRLILRTRALTNYTLAGKRHRLILSIEVEDNGPGFDTSDISQVFDPYVTTKPKGTGLGLAVVKKLVEEHVGTILAENRKNGGAVISIRLPINEAAREAMITKGNSRTEKRRERA